MKKNKQILIAENLITSLLFSFCVFFYIFNSWKPELRGDEAASYIALIPFVNSLFIGKFVPSFLTYFHEPIQLIIQLPLLFAGLYEFIARLPNILSGILLFLILKKICKICFDKTLPTLLLLAFYTVSGYVFLSRLAINIALFGFLNSIFILFLLKWDRTRKKIDLVISVVFLMASIFTYIDAIFFMFGLMFLVLFSNKKRSILERKIVFSLIFFIVLVLFCWAGTVLVGSLVSSKYYWWKVAPFRLILRGGGYSIWSIAENVNTIIENLGLVPGIFIGFFTFYSVFLKKSKLIWIIVFVPTLYFNIVSNPTVHLLHFFPIYLLLCFLGWENFRKRLSLPFNIILVLCTFGVLLISCKETLSRELNLKYTGYKEIATFIRDNSLDCDYVYTQIDGSSERLYIGRQYKQFLTKDIRYILISSLMEPPENLTQENFNLRATVQKNSDNIIGIWEKDYKGDVETLININEAYFSLSSLMPYINKCNL